MSEPVEPVAANAPDVVAPAPKPAGRRAAIRRWVKRGVLVVATIVATLLVTFFTVDLGNITVGGRSLLTIAEREGGKYLRRPLHIGRISALASSGKFALDDVVIEGPTPESPPFFHAKRITVDVPWWSLFRDGLYFDLTIYGWRMNIENTAQGTRLPKLTPVRDPNKPAGPGVKLRYLRIHANDGAFSYVDHLANWSVTTPALQFSIVRWRDGSPLVGNANFKRGLTRIQNFKPMNTDFKTTFRLDGPRVILNHIDLLTDGAESHVTGYVNFTNWPEQEYRITSDVDLATMKDIFFAGQNWRMSGDTRFQGVFKFFKGGRDLSGTFASDEAVLGLGKGEWRFPSLHGALQWTPDRFIVTHADSGLLGGQLRLNYGMAPLGTPQGATATLNAEYEGVDLYGFTRQFGWTALEPEGLMRGRVSMAWPNGRFQQALQGRGETIVEPRPGQTVASETLPAGAPPIPPEQEFVKYKPFGTFPLAADTKYTFTGSDLDFEPGWAATPHAFVRFSGHARGGPVNVPFHVTSHDWQRNDRLFAAIMNNFGSQMGAIEVGGRGTFDGVLTKAFNAPRIEGKFTGDVMRAFKVQWGRATGQIVVENNYLDITDGRIEYPGGGRHITSGRYALGFPRADGGEEINALVRVEGVPMLPLKAAFTLEDWPVDGTVENAEMVLTGGYEKPRGAGRMRLVNATAWDEPLESAEGELRFEGDGSLRVPTMVVEKGGGKIGGSAWLSWAESRYSFRAETQAGGIPVQSLQNFRIEQAPLTGQLSFTAAGESTFDNPAWEISNLIVPDLYAGDEGIGALRGRLVLKNNVLAIPDLSVRSDRLQVTGGGTIAMNDASDAKLQFVFRNTSIDPYLKYLGREFPYSQVIASGAMTVEGPLSDYRKLSADLRIGPDELAMTLFDYPLTNTGELRIGFRNNTVRLEQVSFRNAGAAAVDTELAMSGSVNLTAETSDIQAKGRANLAVLRAFYPELDAQGEVTIAAVLGGRFDALALNGSAFITKGRIKHPSIPQSINEITGPITMQQGRITLGAPDAAGVMQPLRAVLGEGAVTFGGGILLQGYRPVEFALEARGRSMHLRYPADMQSTVDADLFLQGPMRSPTLSGNVDVLRASYLPRFQPEAGYFGYFAGGSSAAGPALAPATPPPAYPISLDIRVRSAPRLPFIDNSEAMIAGTAAMEIRGTADRPVITGRVELDRGEWAFSGYRYKLQGGSIDFTNPAKFEPYFDVAARTDVRAGGQNYAVTIRVLGTFDKLDLDVSSEPWLPEFQIISLLLGESPDVGAAELRARAAPQELQAQALRTAGVAFITSPLTATIGKVVGRATAIDTVQIVPVLGNEASLQQLNPALRLTLGQRIAPNVYITYSRTVGGLRNEIILIEIDQNDQVSWVLSRNEDRTFAVDFRIRHVFR